MEPRAAAAVLVPAAVLVVKAVGTAEEPAAARAAVLVVKTHVGTAQQAAARAATAQPGLARGAVVPVVRVAVPLVRVAVDRAGRSANAANPADGLLRAGSRGRAARVADRTNVRTCERTNVRTYAHADGALSRNRYERRTYDVRSRSRGSRAACAIVFVRAGRRACRLRQVSAAAKARRVVVIPELVGSRRVQAAVAVQ